MTTPRSPRRMAPIVASAVALLAVAAGMAWLARPKAPAPASPLARMNMAIPASFQGQEGVGAKQDLFEGGIAWLNSAQPIRSQDLVGKIILLDFWTFCCVNCHHIIPDLEKLEEKYADELVVIGVHSPKFPAEKDTENIRKKVREYGVKHPVVNDAEMTIWKRFGVRSWPTLAVIDARGNYRGSVSGEGNYETLDAFIGKLVEEHTANGELDETPFVVYAESDRPSDGPLLFPGKVLADAPNNRLFISDTGHHRVVVTNLDGTGLFTIGSGQRGLLDGPFDTARFDRPQGFCLIGETLYVADTENHAIRRVDLAAKTVKTIAGNGTQSYRRNGSFQGTDEGLNSPWDLLPVPGTSELIIAMAGPHQLWKIDLDTNTVTAWAGSGREDIIDGSYETAAFAQPSGLATDGTFVYVADSEVSGIRRVSLSGEQTPQVQTVVGEGLFEFGDVDGVGDNVRLQHCLGLAYGDGTLYIADTYNNKIKACNPEERSVEALVGTGEAGSSDSAPSFYQPGGLSLAGDTLFIADSNNHLVRAYDLASKEVNTLSLDGVSPPKPPRKAPSFTNAERITVPEATVAPGDALTVELSLVIPGFKLQPDSPVLTLIEAPDESDALGPEVSPTGSTALPTGDTLSLPVSLSKTFAPGDTLTLKVSASIFACAEDGGFCTLKQYSWTVPVAFAEGAGSTVSLVPKDPDSAAAGE